MTCIACAGEEHNPHFDYCRCCGNGEPMPPVETAKPPESPLARAVRLARGDIDDVSGFLDRFAKAKAKSATDRANEQKDGAS